MSRNNGMDRRQLLKLAGLSAAGLGLTAAGCGSGSGGSGGPVTIRHSWWGADDRAKKVQQCVTLFEKKHPKIKVKTDFQQYADFWKKFNTQAAGGNPPDVIQNAVTFLRKYEAKNVLLDLGPQAEKGNLDLGGFRSGLEKFAEIDGKLLGVPVGSNSMALVIDEKVYEKAGITPEIGWTWDDWLAGLEKIKRGQEIAGDAGPHGVMYLYDLILRQNGKAFFTEDGMGFGEDELLPYWTEALERVKSGLYADPNKVEQLKPASATAKGLSAGEFTWDNFSVRYSAEGKSSYGLAPIPSTDGKKTGQYLGSLMLSGTARTKHPAEVATFISFMTHDPEVARIMGYDRGVPATTAQFEAYQPADAPSKAIGAYETAIADAGVLEPITPHPAGADVIEAAFLRIGADLSLGKTSPKDSVKQFFSEAKTALGSN
ncbi:extracellular solute-binding protein [Streptomyces sp. NBC_01166]|uniref:ABC transporter substrate-binding protein n=1 Tax=Streptomyces sp. NBC_01166 TaxID=2903755 RepID=UPI003863B843|nr:extracellular solute-binding protein [Streptomyces sp. NBC_01166]